MAWIIGLVTDTELKSLREIGWIDSDPPEVMKSDYTGDGMSVRMFFVDNDVYSIMTGPDWEQPKKVSS